MGFHTVWKTEKLPALDSKIASCLVLNCLFVLSIQKLRYASRIIYIFSSAPIFPEDEVLLWREALATYAKIYFLDLFCLSYTLFFD